MTIIYPINGRNQRLGELFNTPKHLLLYKGVPAIKASIEYMQKRFPDANIMLLVNQRYYDKIDVSDGFKMVVGDTDSQVETLRKGSLFCTGPVMFVDCDIIPLDLCEPIGNTVYLFQNKLWMKQYSNYLLDEDNNVIGCNEKGIYHPYAGAGIYYFEDVADFNNNSAGCSSISEVVAKLPFTGDTESKIFRFGTLNDIKNDERIADSVYR